jgi:hypothetical protein
MAEHEEKPDDQKVAKWTFLATAVLGALWLGSIVAFVLSR